MATGGLYGNSGTGALVATPGAESSGLYGSTTSFGGTYFEWFIFQESATQPATPTGGSWSFGTNTGTPPSGWTLQPPSAPVNQVWVSIALVNSRSTTGLVWSVPGLFGVVPNITFGTVVTGAPGTNAAVVNTGTATNPNLIFTIPRGNTGATGPTGAPGAAATIAAGTTTTGAPGSSATVVNSGTSNAAIFDFTIPRGDVGATGPTGATGATGAAATIAAGTTTTTAPGTFAAVTNVGTSGAAIFDFEIPRGAGVNSGGSVGQVLTKASGTDYDTTWTTIIGTLNYQGSWNALTNTPALTSSVGTNGYYYVVSVAGSTNLNGITDWIVGDWAIFNGSVWQKIDQTDLVTSVAGRTGAVVLSNTDISGLGTMSTQNANAVNITGGSLDGVTIGSFTAGSGEFTSLFAETGDFGSINLKGEMAFSGNAGVAGQVFTSAGDGELPTWETPASGTVTSINVSGGTTGLTTSGGPVTSSGTITLTGTLALANGGTGATTVSGAQTNLQVDPAGTAVALAIALG